MTSYARKLNNAGEKKIEPWVMAAITFIVLCSLGFPGTFVKVIGEGANMAISYFSFLLQILIMAISSGGSPKEIRLVDLKYRYIPIYLFVICIFAVSMVGTSDINAELISCIRFTVTALFALWICDHMSVEQILTVFYHAQIFYVAAAIIFSVFFSDYYDRAWGQDFAFLGLEDTKNVTGMTLCFGILVQILLWKVCSDNRKGVSKFFVPFLVLQIVLMILADGTSAILTAVIVAAVVIIFGDKVRMNLGVVHTAVSIIFLIVAMTLLQLLEPILNAVGKDASISGRIPLWTQILDVIRVNHPMVGFGYGHFWLDEEAYDLIHAGFSRQSFMSHMTAGAHNNMLELWLNTGLIGVIAFFVVIIWVFSHPEWIPRQKYLVCLTYMAYYTLTGLTERSWSTFGYMVFFMFLVAGLACQKVIPEQEEAARMRDRRRLKWDAKFKQAYQDRE